MDDAIEPLVSPSTDDVFEATRPFSAREIASAAASEALSGGGGSQTANYAVIQIDGGPGVGGAPSLSVAEPSFIYPASALTILEQAGTDFSIFDSSGTGYIVSAAGGLMQAGLLVPPQFASASLDGGSTDARWIQIGFQTGNANVSPMNTLGYDCSFQVGALGQQTFPGLPGLVMPGQPAIKDIRFLFENPFGTDSVDCDFWDAEALVVWTIAPLA